jgi:hypothetical protein
MTMAAVHAVPSARACLLALLRQHHPSEELSRLASFSLRRFVALLHQTTTSRRSMRARCGVATFDGSMLLCERRLWTVTLLSWGLPLDRVGSLVRCAQSPSTTLPKGVMMTVLVVLVSAVWLKTSLVLRVSIAAVL